MSHYAIKIVPENSDAENPVPRFLRVEFGREFNSALVFDTNTVGDGTAAGELVKSHNWNTTGAVLASIPVTLLTDPGERAKNDIDDNSEFFLLMALERDPKDTREPEAVLLEYEEILEAMSPESPSRALAANVYAYIRHFQFRATQKDEYAVLDQTSVVCFGYAIAEDTQLVNIDLVGVNLTGADDNMFHSVLDFESEGTESDYAILLEQIASFMEDWYNTCRKITPAVYATMKQFQLVPADLPYEEFLKQYATTEPDQVVI